MISMPVAFPYVLLYQIPMACMAYQLPQPQSQSKSLSKPCSLSFTVNTGAGGEYDQMHYVSYRVDTLVLNKLPFLQ
jgi:hypothetical protein